METFSALPDLCEGNPSANDGFPSQRPVTRSFDVFLDLRLNKRLNKQTRRWLFETQSPSLWRHCNATSLIHRSDEKLCMSQYMCINVYIFSSFSQALCYAELGTVIPKAGGDYVYIYNILGPLPGFICAWTHSMIVAPSANAVISRTAALYMGQALGLSCHDYVITSISIWIIGRDKTPLKYFHGISPL